MTTKGLVQIFVTVLSAVPMLSAVVRAELPDHLVIAVRANGQDRELNLHKYSMDESKEHFSLLLKGTIQVRVLSREMDHELV